MSDQPSEERKKKKKHKKHKDKDRERDGHHSIKEQYDDSLIETINEEYSGQCFIDQSQNNDNDTESGAKSLKIKFKFGQTTTTATTTSAFSPNSDSNSIPNIKILTKSPLVLSPNDDSRLSTSHELEKSVNLSNTSETIQDQLSVKKEKKDKKKKKHKKHHHHHKHHKSKSETVDTVTETNEGNHNEDNSNKKLSPQIYTFTNKIKLSLDFNKDNVDPEEENGGDEEADEENVDDENDIVLEKKTEEEINDERIQQPQHDEKSKTDKKEKKEKREKKEKKDKKDKKENKTTKLDTIEPMDVDDIVLQNNDIEKPLSVDVDIEMPIIPEVKSEATPSPVTNKVPEIKLKLSKSGTSQQYSLMSSPNVEKFVQDNSSPKSRISPIPNLPQEESFSVAKKDPVSDSEQICESLSEPIPEKVAPEASVSEESYLEVNLETVPIIKEQPVSPLVLSISSKFSPSTATIVSGTGPTLSSSSIVATVELSNATTTITTTSPSSSSSTTSKDITTTASSSVPIISTDTITPAPPSTISPKTQKKKESSTKGFNALLQYLLKQLQKKDADGFFALPVSDSIAPSYSTIITNPMDLYTISKKIQAFQYSTLGDFRYDVKLMVDNAMKYNQPDTIYYKAASKLWHFNKQKLFKKDALTDYAKHYELSPQELSLNLSQKGGKTNSLNFDSSKQSFFDNTGLFMDANCKPFTGLDDDSSNADKNHPSKLFGNNSTFGLKAGKSGLKPIKNKSQEIFSDGLTKEQYFSQIKNAAAAVRERAAKKRNYFTFLTQEDDPKTIVANIRDDFEKQIYRQEIPLDDIYSVKDSPNGEFCNIFEPTHRLATLPDPSIVVPVDKESEELRKKLIPIYGNNSFGLDYALSISKFAKNNDYSSNLVTSLLDVLTGQKHRTVQSDFHKLLDKNIPK